MLPSVRQAGSPSPEVRGQHVAPHSPTCPGPGTWLPGRVRVRPALPGPPSARRVDAEPSLQVAVAASRAAVGSRDRAASSANRPPAPAAHGQHGPAVRPPPRDGGLATKVKSPGSGCSRTLTGLRVACPLPACPERRVSHGCVWPRAGPGAQPRPAAHPVSGPTPPTSSQDTS